MIGRFPTEYFDRNVTGVNFSFIHYELNIRRIRRVYVANIMIYVCNNNLLASFAKFFKVLQVIVQLNVKLLSSNELVARRN